MTFENLNLTPAELERRVVAPATVRLRARRRLSYRDQVVVAGAVFACDKVTAAQWIASGAAVIAAD